MIPAAGPDTCVAYLLRHGATDNNLADPPLLQGRSVDGSLSDQGRREADRAAECLSEFAVSAIYSSPLRRARETAEAIARFHDLPVGLISDIAEVDVGAWEHRSWVEIQATERQAYENFQNNPARFGYRDGENLVQVADRVVPAVESLMHDHLGQRIVIVGHNVVNRVFLAHALGMPLALARRIHQQNCGINALRYRERRTIVDSINAYFHLLLD